jgi:copper chaperone CopZ
MSQTLELNIEGMTCADCVLQVTEALNDVSGVRVLEVGLGTAKLALEEGADEQAALDAVRRAGYEPSKN